MGPTLIADHAQKTTEEISDHQYINMLLNSIIDDEIGESLEYRHLIKCDKHINIRVKYFSNGLVCLAQGVGDRVKGTYTIFLISRDKISTYMIKGVTYGKFVCNCRPQKD